MGAFGIDIKGPDGRMIAAQVSRADREMRSDWLPDVMRVAGMYLRQVIMKRQFDTSGGYLGAPWTPNTPSWAAWKAEHWSGTAPGIRTGAMMKALTGDASPFSMSGLTYPDEEPTSIQGTPILKYDADSVTIGAEVTEDGIEYTDEYNREWGALFGGGDIPSETAIELGKLLSIPFMAGAETAKRAGVHVTHNDFPDDILLKMISVQALRQVFA